MRVGIGLPVTVPGTRPEQLTEWARRAEQRGFSALTTIDRLLFPGYESLIALAAASAVTRRIALMTALLVAPLRSAAVLAKEALTLHALSGGRFTLVVAVGSRAEDYEAAGAEFRARGRLLDRQVARIREIWRGEGMPRSIGPAAVAPGGPKLLVGGHSSASLVRAARFGSGWLAGGERGEVLGHMSAQLRAAWRDEGREGEPELHAADYFALGPDSQTAVEGYMGDYFSHLPDGGAGLAASVPTTAAGVRELRDSYRDAGVTQLILNPCSAELEQVDRLADALFD